ncbi:hypothetical protein JCM16303_005866 [Sporobolomyces ruberrimus]
MGWYEPWDDAAKGKGKGKGKGRAVEEEDFDDEPPTPPPIYDLLPPDQPVEHLPFLAICQVKPKKERSVGAVVEETREEAMRSDKRSKSPSTNRERVTLAAAASFLCDEEVGWISLTGKVPRIRHPPLSSASPSSSLFPSLPYLAPHLYSLNRRIISSGYKHTARPLPSLSMDLPSASFGSLPPELVSAIVDHAAECISSYSSWRDRQNTLYSLTLVNRTIRSTAQALLAKIVHIRLDKDGDPVLAGLPGQEARTLTYDVPENTNRRPQIPTTMGSNIPDYSIFRFKFIRELRLVGVTLTPFSALDGHTHLERLSLISAGIEMELHDHTLSLPRLVELSLDSALIFSDTRGLATTFFSRIIFPSLRALGIRKLPVLDRSSLSSPGIPSTVLSQLQCLTASIDLVKTHRTAESFPSPRLVLFVLEPQRRSNSPAYEASIKSAREIYSSFTIRSDNDAPTTQQFKSTVVFVEEFINTSSKPEQLYLSKLWQKVMGNEELEEGARDAWTSLEKMAKEKSVEIIWEDDGDDPMRSLVSKEFWERCKRGEEQRKREGNEA